MNADIISTILANLNAITNPHVFMAYALMLCFGAAMAAIIIMVPALAAWSVLAHKYGWFGCHRQTGSTGLR